MSIYTPSRLYVKKHTVTGLRYFGKSVRENIDQYDGSGKYWLNHIRKHSREYIITEWISDWFYDEKEIKKFALAFSEIFDIVNRNDWANLKDENGTDGGPIGAAASKKLSDIFNDPEWKATIGKEKAEKISKTRNNPDWKATVGKEATNKRIKTVNDPIFKATIAKESYKKMSETKSNPDWKATVGKEQSIKLSASIKQTLNDPDWKATVGKEQKAKRKITMSTPEWKKAHSKTCEYCYKTVNNSSYTRWHGDNCKLLK